MTETVTERIRALNDALRRSGRGGDIYLTRGVAELPPELRATIIAHVREFADFTPENDPHGEHDFGAFQLAGLRFCWKIDYYDRARQYGSPNPSDPRVTTRLLTILLADEY